MKRITLVLLLSITAYCCDAQAIKLSTWNAKYSKSEGGIAQQEWGGPAATNFTEQEFGGVYVYVKVDFVNSKAIKAKNHLQVIITEVKDGKESVNYLKDMFVPTKNGWVFVYSQFTAGTYNVRIQDQDNEADVYSRTTFTVTGRPKPDYKHNSTLVVCKSVDDNWNPVGLAKSFKVGECMNFLYKAKDRMNYGVLIWNVARVKEDGTEEYVTHLSQNGGFKPFRWLATTEGVCVFDKPGKYRVYLFDKNDYENRHDEDSPYIGKGEFTVQ